MSDVEGTLIVVAAAVIGGYMALNIGANDVANNMGPAVGSKALTLVGALAIAAICETAGALLAGGDVVRTVSRGIIAPESGGGAAALHLGDDGGASGRGAVDQPGDLDRRAGLDHAFDRRRGDGRGDRGGRVSRGELADDGRDRGELGDLAGAGRADRGAVSAVIKAGSSTARTRSPRPGSGCRC
jgi:hypothetical protein